MLTRLQAEQLVLRRIKPRYESADLSIAECNRGERTFGWVFRLAWGGADANNLSGAMVPRMVIVNKYSAQVVASTVEYEVEQFVKLYEKLLSQNQARSKGWCMTARSPIPWPFWRRRTVAERAKDAGLYEIRGKEDEP